MASRRSRILLASVAGGALALSAAASVWLLRERTAAYTSGEAVEGITTSLAREAPAKAPPIVLVDVTREAGIAFTHFGGTRSTQLPEDMGSGAAFGDVDADGDDDLFLPNFSGPLSPDGSPSPDGPTSALYLNRGDGTFEDVTGASGLARRGAALAAAFGDADGDGDLDLAVAQFGHCRLFRNRGDGTFDDVSDASGIGGPEGFWTGLSWADYDRDGDLDLHACGYVRYRPGAADRAGTSRQYEAVIPFTLNPSSFEPERNLLFRNDAKGRFDEVAKAAGVDNPTGRSLSATWADFDEDGWLDLYVANDVSDNAMYRNRGDGTFEDVSHAAWVADYRGAMGLGVGDFDGDLDLDIFVTHWIAQENALYRSMLRDLRRASQDAKSFRFVDVADSVGLGQIALSLVGWGTDFVDFDADGRLDLLVVNGSTFQREDDPSRLVPMRSFLFWNAGTGGFFDVSNGSPAVVQERVGRGAAFSDVDADGDVDAVMTTNGGAAVLLRNEGGDRRAWIEIRLEGMRSPRSGVGSRIEVEAGGRRQVRLSGGSSSYLSQSSATTHVGLGDAERVDVVEVRWTSGHVDVVRDLPVRAIILITEGGGWTLIARPGASGAALPIPIPDARREFWARYARAKAAREAGDLDAAITAYRDALTLQQDHEDALYWLGNSLLETDRGAEALGVWSRLVEVNPLSSRAHQQIGVVRSLPGATFDLTEAEAHFRRASDINREESGPFVRLGEVLVATGRLEEAHEWLSAAARLNPKAASALYLSGYVKWKAGHRAEAVSLLQRAARALEEDKAVVKGATSEGDTQAKLRDLHRAALRKSLFGSLWTDLRERHDPATIDERAAGVEFARVDVFVAGLGSGEAR